MKFLSLHVQGFGSLRPGEYRFGDRTLVVEDNAAGKSTLAAALRAAVYGLEADRRRQQGFTDHEAWRPWRGDAYGVALRLETAAGVFTIERDFAPGGAGQLTVRDAAGADLTARFLAGKGRDRVGELLFGVAEAEFLRAVFATDRAWGRPWSDGEAGRLADLLGSVVSSDEGGGPATAAIAACDEALRRYDGVTVKGPAQVDTEIQRLEQRLGQLRADREATARRHEGALETLSRLDELRSRLARLDGALTANRQQRLRAQAMRQRRELEARTRLEAELSAAQRRAAALAHLDGFPPGREAELAAWAERCAQHDREAQGRRRRVDETLRPELERLEADLATAGPEGPGVTGELESGVGALLEREARLAELRGERESLRTRIAGEGEDPGLQELVHAGLTRLGETERRFLREQERLDFEREETTARLDRDESTVRDAMTAWERAAGRFARGRNAAAALAGVGGVGALVALLLRRPTGPSPWPAIGLCLVVAAAAGAVAIWLQRRRAALSRRRQLQGSERLAALGFEREALAQREAARRGRLAEIAPALLGPDLASGLAPTADDLTALYRRHESFRVRHDAWFRVTERIGEEEAEVARLQARLTPFLATVEAETREPVEPGVTLRLQAELGRRRRVAVLAERGLRLREAIAEAQREADEHATAALEASRRAAAVLAVLPKGCRYGEGAATEDGSVRDEIARLAPLFRHDPGAAAAWFAARAAEAEEARRLAGEMLPALTRRLAELPPAAEIERVLAATEDELTRVSMAAAAAAGSEAPAAAAVVVSTDVPAGAETLDDLLAQGESLQARRDALAKEIAEQARGVADVERERRAHLPELARQEQDLLGALLRARDFRDAVTLAREVIARLAGDVYGRWAAALDADAARLATRLCPEIAGIAFSPELDYVVALADGRQLDAARADRQLSSGVRDQLVLAVRLALARFLARPGDPLPLVLDDPFARYDDGRFRRGMTVLAEEASGHQIILLTCQRERVRWLRDVDPGIALRWERLDIG